MKKLLLAIPVLASALLAGCGPHYGYAGYVSYGPPPPRVEVRGFAPAPGYAWVDGFWGYRGSRYAWTPGYWARPPRPGCRWVPGYWENSRRGHRWVAGYWR